MKRLEELEAELKKAREMVVRLEQERKLLCFARTVGAPMEPANAPTDGSEVLFVWPSDDAAVMRFISGAWRNSSGHCFDISFAVSAQPILRAEGGAA